jgi:transglutaminase-like putative cysteine protease
MKKLFLLGLLVLGASLACAQLDLSAELISREQLSTLTRAAADYPDADILLLENQTRIRYETNGTYRSLSDTAYQILTEKGRQEKSSVSTFYDKKYGTARFVRAEVVKPDGRIIPIDLTAQSRESIEQGQMSANIYDPNYKIIRLTIPGLEIGDVLRYTVASDQTKVPVPNTWGDLITGEETFPVIHAVYEVDAPAALPPVRIELKDEIAGTVTNRTATRGDRILYTWEIRDVPQLFGEPKMPAAYTVCQRLLLSTIPDWETLSKWYWNLSKPRLDAINPAMEAKVRELTEGLTDRQQKIEAIFRFVSQEIRYMGITIEDEAPGYEPHDVSLTFDNRYGVCRDKAALLVSMLKLAGFEACPVLINVGPKLDPNVPTSWFNHAITAVRNEDGSWQLMDATNENTRDLLPAYLSYRSYLVASPEGETLKTSPVTPPEKNMLRIAIDASLDETQTITAQAVLSFDGINDSAYRGWMAGLKPDDRESAFEDSLKQALGPARLTRLKITPENIQDTTVPLSVEIDFEVSNALAAGANDSLLQVPTLFNNFGFFWWLIQNGIGLETRRFPLCTDITCGVSETVRLSLRNSRIRPALLPTYETIDTPELYISRSVSATNDLLISSADILLRTVEFSPEQYLTLKQNMEALERNARKRIILEPGRISSGADWITLSETVRYTLYNSTTWKEERTVQQKVLTYAGKKQLSDLRFSYNPAMQDMVLNSATVTSPDGKIQPVDPGKEINVMDAQWASDAPRYPAEKTMVVNLPGVKVGSLIDYQVSCTYSNVPFFSTEEYFADDNPVVSKTVRVEMPYKTDLKISDSNPATVRRRTAHKINQIVHEWTSQTSAVIQAEGHLPPEWIIKPFVLLSCGNTGDYAALLEKTLLTAAAKRAAVTIKAQQLTQEQKTRLQKIAAIRDFVDRAIREVGPGLAGLPLSSITPADQTLAEGYGNTTDRAVLLYALLDAAELKPRFILSSDLPQAPGAAEPMIKTLQRDWFGTVLVAVNSEKKKTIYLGDSGQYAEPGTLAHSGRPAIDLKNGKISAPQAGLPDATETRFVLNLSETGDLELHKLVSFFGTDFEHFHEKFAQFTPEKLRRAHQTMLAQFSQSAQTTNELQTSFNYPGQYQFSANIPAYAVCEGKQMYFTLPEGLGNLLGLETSRRENPFCIEDPVRRMFLYEITLPAGWEPVILPEAFRTELPAGAGTVETTVSSEKQWIIIKQTAQLNPAIIPAEDYGQLLALNARLTGPGVKTVLLRKK